MTLFSGLSRRTIAILAVALLALLVPVLPAAGASPEPVRPAVDFWVATNGPQGGDAFALATNASGHVFVGTQGGAQSALVLASSLSSCIVLQ